MVHPGPGETHFAPGTKWALLFGLADPYFPDEHRYPREPDAGKLMALAAFGDADSTDPAVTEIVDRVLTMSKIWPAAKHEFRETPIYNAGVEAYVTKDAAAVLSKRIFQLFSAAAVEHLPPGIPLHISGGCGLNCDWNKMWRGPGPLLIGLRASLSKRRRPRNRQRGGCHAAVDGRPLHRLGRVFGPGIRVGRGTQPCDVGAAPTGPPKRRRGPRPGENLCLGAGPRGDRTPRAG